MFLNSILIAYRKYHADFTLYFKGRFVSAFYRITIASQ